MTKYTSELLAPASNLTNAIIAFKSGADAVYAGLKEFNARERSENFTLEEFSTLMQYAKAEKKKVYLTVNTLFKDSETKSMLKFLEGVSTVMPDSIIVQDFGVFNLAKKYFPELTIHASTQMGIHNSAGVNLVESLGAKRIILERQITFDEIKQIKKSTTAELEVFVHGALCCCLSGSCLFSSWMGGHSGNRGKCKQPCRRRFHSDKGNGFFFSANDLYSLDIIKDLQEIGIDSFKIEGRVKKADYVENVVKAYRMVMDNDADNKVLGEARNILSRSGGRKWSGGFVDEKSFKTVVNHEKMGVSGSLCGFMESKNSSGLKIKAIANIKVGDYLRVQPKSGDEGPTVFVTYIKVNGKNVKSLKKDEIGFIGYKKELPDGNCNIYKVGSLKENMPKIPEISYKKALALNIEVSQNGFDIKVINDNKNSQIFINHPFEIAQKKGADLNKIAEEFNKIILDDKYIAKVNVFQKDDTKLFILDKMVKEIKKEFILFLEKLNFTDKKVAYNLPKSAQTINREVTVFSTKKRKEKGIKSSSIFNFSDYHTEVTLPQFCPEFFVKNLEELIQKAYKQGIRKFRVTSIFAFELLKKYSDIEINTSFPLQISNSESFAFFENLNAHKMMLTPELEEESIKSLVDNFAEKCEIYKYGRLPIFQTRAELPIIGKISDGRGADFTLEKDKFVTLLYPQKALETPNFNKASHYFDFTNTNELTQVSDFNFYREFT